MSRLKIHHQTLAAFSRAQGWKPPAPHHLPDQTRPLDAWSMERDDAPILRHLFQQAQPDRHLEFGTWEGFGAALCLLESRATVWSINTLDGQKPNNRPVYGTNTARFFSTRHWSERLGLAQPPDQTDHLGFIGRFVLERGLGHRFLQCYSDSRDWDDHTLPDGFFDTIFIDGAHDAPIVAADALKAIRLVKAGGFVIWHDYCPAVREKFDVVQGVISGLEAVAAELSRAFSDLTWIEPSWLLIGTRKGKSAKRKSSREAHRVHPIEAIALPAASGRDDAQEFFRLIHGRPDLATTLRDENSRTPPGFDAWVDNLLSDSSTSRPDQMLLRQIQSIRRKLEPHQPDLNHASADFLGLAFKSWRPSRADVLVPAGISRICDHSSLFSPAQIIQVAAFVRAFRPDVVIEVGREVGLSTATLAWGLRLVNPEARLISFSASHNPDVGRNLCAIEKVVVPRLTAEVELVDHGIEKAAPAIRPAERVAVFWNDPRTEAVDYMLSKFLPNIAASPHTVIVHGISDGRLNVPPPYTTENSKLLTLGDLWSYHPHLPRLLDFATRNGILLHSADLSLTNASQDDPAVFADRTTTWAGQFSSQADWRWLTLNGVDSLRFPQTAEAEPTKPK